MTFNYQKAYFTLAVPAFNNLNKQQKQAHKKIMLLTKDLSQNRSLNIPLNKEIKDILKPLSCLEIAQISIAGYFVGHWKPSLTPSILPEQGTSWKVPNICDQILKKRLKTPHHIQIHEGKFRVTFSSKDCWTWEEFSLATEENLCIFKNCNLSFNENTLKNSANKLKLICNDLWEDVKNVPDNKEYLAFKERVKQQERELKEIENDTKNSKIKLKAFKWLIENDIDTDNCIFYTHKNTFCFGCRDKLSSDEKQTLEKKLKDFGYKYEFK